MAIGDSFKNYSEKIDSTLAAWIIISVTLLTASVFIILKGPELGSDSYSYLQMYVNRPPGYPLFLLLLRLFGDNYLMVTVVVQTLLNAAVFILFIRYICKTFNLHVLHTLFLLPLITYFFVDVVEPQEILTESIAFPLFVFLSTYFIDGLIKKDIRSLIIVLVLNTILVLIRGQFLFVYPLVVLAGMYVYLRKESINIRSVVTFSLAVILTFASYALINRVYHYVAHNTFSDTQTNMSFIRNALYITDEDDYLLFEDEVMQAIHQDMYDSFYSIGYSADAFYEKVQPIIPKEERRRSDLIQHYHENLILMEPIIRSEIIRNKYPDLDETEFQVVRDRILREFASTLISENPSFYFYLVFGDVYYYGFGGNREFILMFLLLFGISFFGLVRQNHYGEIIFFYLTGHLGNLLLMALANRVLGRYSIYIQFVVYTILLIFFLKMMLENEGKLWHLNKDISPLKR